MNKTKKTSHDKLNSRRQPKRRSPKSSNKKSSRNTSSKSRRQTGGGKDCQSAINELFIGDDLEWQKRRRNFLSMCSSDQINSNQDIISRLIEKDEQDYLDADKQIDIHEAIEAASHHATLKARVKFADERLKLIGFYIGMLDSEHMNEVESAKARLISITGTVPTKDNIESILDDAEDILLKAIDEEKVMDSMISQTSI